MKISVLIASFLLVLIKSVTKTASDAENWKNLLLNSNPHVWDFVCHKSKIKCKSWNFSNSLLHRINCCRAHNKRAFIIPIDLYITVITYKHSSQNKHINGIKLWIRFTNERKFFYKLISNLHKICVIDPTELKLQTFASATHPCKSPPPIQSHVE